MWYFSGALLTKLYHYGGHTTTSPSQVQSGDVVGLGAPANGLAPFGQLQPPLALHCAQPNHPWRVHHSQSAQQNFTHRNI